MGCPLLICEVFVVATKTVHKAPASASSSSTRSAVGRRPLYQRSVRRWPWARLMREQLLCPVIPPGVSTRVRRGRTCAVQAERVARNNATFREANEGIAAKAQQLGLDAELIPFLCECVDERCTQQLPG